jgi:hypothetical protein
MFKKEKQQRYSYPVEKRKEKQRTVTLLKKENSVQLPC